MGASTSGSTASVAVRTRSAESVAAARAAKKAERGRQLLQKYATGIQAKLRPFILSPQGKAMFAGFAAGLMLASSAGVTPFAVVHPSDKHVAAVSLPSQLGSSFYPYVVPTSAYSLPSVVPFPGNSSMPKLVSAMIGAQPVYGLLSVEPWKGGSLLIFELGFYAPSLANGTLCSGADSDHASNKAVGDGNLCDPKCVLSGPPSELLAMADGTDCGKGNGGTPGNGGALPPSHDRSCVSSLSDEPVATGRAGGGPATDACLSTILNGTQPILFGAPSVVATFPTVVDGDALAGDGLLLVASASTAGSTTAFFSSDLGGAWTTLGTEPGGSPEVALSSDEAVGTSIVPGGSLEIASFPLPPAMPNVATEPAALSAVPVLTATDEIGVVASLPNDSVTYYSSFDRGATFGSHFMTHFAPGSTSPIFNSIGGTALATPGGIPGQVTAVSSGRDVFALWTTSLDGRVVAATTASGDGGSTWVGPYMAMPYLGSVEDPSATVSPAGDVYVTWRENGLSAWQVDQAVYNLDGRVMQSPSPLPVGYGPGQLDASAPTVAVDELERPGYAWAVETSNGSEMLFTSSHLGPVPALAEMRAAISHLSPEDFNASVNATTSKALLLNLTDSLLNETAHLRSLGAPAQHVIAQVEQELYPNVTSLPLILLCGGTNSTCTFVLNSSSRPPSLIANNTGPFVANKYLAVYADWVLEALGVAVLAPAPDDPIATNGDDSLTVTESAVNPITGELDMSTSAQPVANSVDLHPCPGFRQNHEFLEYQNVDYPTSYTYTINANVPATGYSSSGSVGPAGAGVSTAYLTQIPETDTVSWSVSVSVAYTRQVTYTNCTGYVFELPGSTTRSETIGPATDTSGPITVSFVPDPPVIQVVGTAAGMSAPGALSLHWNNTMPSLAGATLMDDTTGQSIPLQDPSTGYDTEEDPWFYPLTSTGWGDQFTIGAALTSESGSTPSSQNVISMGGPSTAPPLTSSWMATITPPAFPTIQPGYFGTTPGVSDITGTSATVSWTEQPYCEQGSPACQNPTTDPISSLTYGETGAFASTVVSVPQVAPYLCIDPDVHNYCFTSVPISGLMELTNYTAYATATFYGSGYTVTVVLPISFLTAGAVSLTETDLPYDSLTQEGGGAGIFFVLGNGGLSFPPQAFASGYVSSVVETATPSYISFPMTALEPVPGFTELYQVNLTVGLVPQTGVSVALMLNLTVYGSLVSFVSVPFSFVYQQDTSGDGLTDAEKAQGWTTTTTALDGTISATQVSADYTKYATNGLTSDRIEKQFGLDPRTVDSAGSQMLDMYNMTFDLGLKCANEKGHPANPLPTLPGIEVWREDDPSSCQGSGSPFDPFNACPAPSFGTTCSFAPSLHNEYANITTSSGADDSVWASEQLWTVSALGNLQRLVDEGRTDVLRGVTGAYDGELTLTVWGKLSWGANPLAASTPQDHLADGARVNPLHEVDLQVALPLGATIYNTLSTCSSFNLDAGYAIQLFVNQTDSSGTPEFQGYSNEGYFCPTQSDPPSLPPYTLTLPVDNTVPTQSVQFQWIINNAQCQPGQSGCNNPYVLSKVPLDASCHTVFSISVDLVSAPYPDLSGTPNYNLQAPKTCAPNQGYLTQVSIDAGAVPAGVKTQTFLWVPTDNSTLSNLPLGLQRYTGEQDFVVVTANVNPGQGSGFVSAEIPNPWGNPAYTQATNNQYQLAASQGLVSFVIPRAQFLNSPFGQAVAQDTVAQYPTTNPPPLPIVGGSLAGSGGLECYWQNRAVAPSSFSPSSSPLDLTQTCLNNDNPMTGTYLGTTNIVRMVADTGGCSSGNCGGVPSNPALEAGNQAPALQALVTLNLSSASELDNLLAALLDNSTGGLNGTFQDFTQFLPSLGINSAVMSALPNVAVVDSGIFGIPVSLAVPPPPPPPSCNGLGCLWNAVSGVVGAFVGAIVNGIEGFAGAVWSAVQAATEFLEAAAAGLYAIGENAVGAAVVALKAVAGVLEAALQALVNLVVSQMESILGRALAPVVAGIEAYDRAADDGFSAAHNDTLAGQADSPTLISDLANSLSGSVFVTGLTIAAVLAIVLAVALPVDIGPSFVAGLVVTIVLTVAFTAADATGLLSAVTSAFDQLSQGTFDVLQSFVDSHPLVARAGVRGTPTTIGSSSAQPTLASATNPNWVTAARVLLAMGFFSVGFPLAVNNLFKAKPGFTTGFLTAVLGLALSFVSIAFFIAVLGHALHATPDEVLIVGLALSVLGVIRIGVALAEEKNVYLRALEGVAAAFAGLGLVIALFVDSTTSGI